MTSEEIYPDNLLDEDFWREWNALPQEDRDRIAQEAKQWLEEHDEEK
jgi:hypothetical protein